MSEDEFHQFCSKIYTEKFNDFELASQFKSEFSQLKDERLGMNLTVLHYAAKQNLPILMELAINKGADVNAVESCRSETPMHIVCDNGYEECVNILLSHGADVNIKNGKRLTCIDIAYFEGHNSIIEKIIEHQKRNMDAATFRKFKNRISPTPQYVIKFKQFRAKMSNKDDFKDVDLIRQLKPKFIHLKASWDNTILHDATYWGRPVLLKHIIRKGADINAIEAFTNSTALHIACWEGQDECVSVLLAHGADADVKNIDGYTCLDLAKKNKKNSIIQQIEEHQQRRFNQMDADTSEGNKNKISVNQLEKKAKKFNIETNQIKIEETFEHQNCKLKIETEQSENKENQQKLIKQELEKCKLESNQLKKTLEMQNIQLMNLRNENKTLKDKLIRTENVVDNSIETFSQTIDKIKVEIEEFQRKIEEVKRIRLNDNNNNSTVAF